jgi:hypothetical protein
MKGGAAMTRLYLVSFALLLTGCFLASAFRSGGVEILPAEGPQPVRDSYTVLQKTIKVDWENNLIERTTRKSIQEERRKGYSYTPQARCLRHHTSSLNLMLMRKASIVRGADAVIQVEYGGYYGYPYIGDRNHRQLHCWGQGIVIGRGLVQKSTGTVGIKIRDNRTGTTTETQY